MNSSEVRKTFLDFFRSKNHQIVPSAPMVIKNDPTLMFTNAGMNQFKDIFLGNAPVKYPRVADTQKCLRVSGKHNDLEEVGHDTYHHTMFEMLGNWSFGDYFKKEAIEWAWELLVDVYHINPANLYFTVFGGDDGDGLPKDEQAWQYWRKIVPEDRILLGSKKDNFWEMGETGPCGPCSEIHIDLRDEAEKLKIPGRDLVNTGHPLVIEIWNLVFIEFNRTADGTLLKLPAQHVDTGMGFERLCMVIQGKKSNYDTDVFQDVIGEIAGMAGLTYGNDAKADIAMRVIADHLRAITFAIADGQLPSNVRAGYVIRRILRRAVRYGYTFLGFKEPFLHRLLGVLVRQMGEVFPEIRIQQALIGKVIAEEEQAFLRTLSLGVQRFEHYVPAATGTPVVDGGFAFELFDTYGFPVDLTQLMAREKGWTVDMEGFRLGMEEQKNRSRQAAAVDTGDWVVLAKEENSRFIGYDELSSEVKILKYRKVKAKNREFYQIVFDQTPFYAESGGQVGDRGILETGAGVIPIEDTLKENELTVHITSRLPEDPTAEFTVRVDEDKRRKTANNHSATHLLHAALRQVLGTHVEQKGSLVDENRLRFDFSHFARMSEEEIAKVEAIVNSKVRLNIPLTEFRNLPFEEARSMGAVALFGEKYGEFVRVVTFDPEFSMEFCGGTHVAATGQIGMFKIVSESAIAAGIRRIEALTADGLENWFLSHLQTVEEVKSLLKTPLNPVNAVRSLLEENALLRKKNEELNQEKTGRLKEVLLGNKQVIKGITFISSIVDLEPSSVKDLAFELKASSRCLFLVLGTIVSDKANLSVALSDDLVTDRNMDASRIVRELAQHIQGGGGGQPSFATAGGKNPGGLPTALEMAKTFIPK